MKSLQFIITLIQLIAVSRNNFDALIYRLLCEELTFVSSSAHIPITTDSKERIDYQLSREISKLTSIFLICLLCFRVDYRLSREISELTSITSSKPKEKELSSKLESISNQINVDYPDSSTELDIFPSGAIMLDVRYQDKLFVIDYAPDRGFEVDEVTEEDGFNTGYNFITQDVDEAIIELNRLMSRID